MNSIETLPVALQEQLFLGNDEAIHIQEEASPQKLFYFVNKVAFQEIAVQAGHTTQAAARAANWLLKLESARRSVVHHEDYGIAKPSSMFHVPRTDSYYFDLSAMDEVVQYAEQIDLAKYTAKDLKIDSTIGYIGAGTLDVYETMGTYYDLYRDSVESLNN